MGELSPWHWAVVILVLVLLFGAKRLPEAARGIGRSARILKAELHHSEPEDTAAPPHESPVEPSAPSPSVTAEEPRITRVQSPSRPD